MHSSWINVAAFDGRTSDHTCHFTSIPIRGYMAMIQHFWNIKNPLAAFNKDGFAILGMILYMVGHVCGHSWRRFQKTTSVFIFCFDLMLNILQVACIWFIIIQDCCMCVYKYFWNSLLQHKHKNAFSLIKFWNLCFSS